MFCDINDGTELTFNPPDGSPFEIVLFDQLNEVNVPFGMNEGTLAPTQTVGSDAELI